MKAEWIGSLGHKWQRVPEPLFYEDPLYIAYPPFFKFCPTTPLPCRCQTPHPLLFLLSCFVD